MHIYQGPLLQLTIHLCNTTTPNKFNIQQNPHILRADVPPPIDYRPMEHQYTEYVSHIAECTYTKAPLLTINVWNTTTLNKINI